MPFRDSVEITSIVNMFGRELGHTDYNKTGVHSLIEKKKLGERSFEIVRLEDKSGDEPSSRNALLAMHRQKAQTWLFPFIADRELINQQLDNFYTFCNRPLSGQAKYLSEQSHQVCHLPSPLILQSNQHGKPPAIGNENHPLK